MQQDPNYYQHAVSSKTFAYIDNQIREALWRWCTRRHPNKTKSWVFNKYYKKKTIMGSRFSASYKGKDGKQIPIFIRHACDTPIRRHIKIQANANPYDPEFKEYFELRDKSPNTRISKGCKTFKIANELATGPE